MRLASLALVLVCACDPAFPEADAGPCSLGVAIGTEEDGVFVPLRDGDPVELVLGFQGFRMLSLALRAEGVSASVAEISAYVSLEETGVELAQRTREGALATDGGLRIPTWLVFFNDEPPARVVGHAAALEVILRAGGCQGGTRVEVIVRDDDACIDHGIVLDAGARDAGVADAAACELGP